jgi:hypothetical protein
MSAYGNGFKERYSELAAADNRFRIDRREVKQILFVVVNETLSP